MQCEKDISTLLTPLCISLNRVDSDKGDQSKPVSEIVNVNLFEKCKPKETSRSSKEVNLNSIQRYLCSHAGCNKLFGKQSRLTLHERTHTGERPFKCHHENCDRSYTRQFHLTRHLTVSHSSTHQNSKDAYRCDTCNKDFKNVYSMKKHETRFHRGSRYTCKECGQMFRKQQHLKTHSFLHTGIKPYKCDFPGCEGRFIFPSVLKRHSLSHVKGRYLCPYDECSRKLDSYTELRHHLTNSHPKFCDVCGMEFNMISRLRTHLLSHQEIREAFFCPFTPCERYYFDERNLRNHICSKHDENFKGFLCPICNKWLVTKQKLKFHLNTHDLNKPSKKTKSPKTRKPRKDKGVSRTDYAKLLSGYSSSEENEGKDPQGREIE